MPYRPIHAYPVHAPNPLYRGHSVKAHNRIPRTLLLNPCKLPLLQEVHVYWNQQVIWPCSMAALGACLEVLHIVDRLSLQLCHCSPIESAECVNRTSIQCGLKDPVADAFILLRGLAIVADTMSQVSMQLPTDNHDVGHNTATSATYISGALLSACDRGCRRIFGG
jgi:hypothetical protein